MKYAMQKRARKMSESCEEHGTPDCGMCYGGKMAEGGMVEEEEETGYGEMPKPMAEDDEGDMISRIMKRRMMSKGGMVANDTPPEADFDENDFDDLAMRDHLEGHYPGSQEIGDAQENDDRRDIVSRIMKSRAKKDRMPRPA